MKGSDLPKVASCDPAGSRDPSQNSSFLVYSHFRCSDSSFREKSKPQKIAQRIVKDGFETVSST